MDSDFTMADQDVQQFIRKLADLHEHIKELQADVDTMTRLLYEPTEC